MELRSSPISSKLVRGAALFFGAIVIFAILFPIFAQSKGRRIERGSLNLKIILTASTFYCTDNNELLPPMGHWESAQPASGPWIQGDQMAWREVLQPYMKDYDRFRHPAWPFRAKEGSRLELVRGVTNGASCYGYVAEITPKWFGSTDGSLHLNPEDPPEGFLKELGVDRTQAPLLEDLAWTEPGWFGQVHTHRILDKSSRPGQKVVGYMDGSAKAVPATVGEKER